ncbi:hypothetical protein ACT3S7_04535 [Corynebacterium sp. AOP34-AQ2-28]|uniref:hypothetical protein n=1 Tax=Corynebacterium sp. AOP34-AQ2-28 TaxID=3457689 RepID=UPI0040344061
MGAPHHRARVFLIAYPADAERIRPEAPRRGRGHGEEVAGAVGGPSALPDGVTHLPTPNASDSSGGGQTADKRVGHSRQLIDAVLDLGAQPYLPTPTTGYSGRSPEEWRDARPAGNGARREAIGDLEVAMKEVAMKEGVRHFLPTPTCADSDRERNNPAQAKRHSPPLSATLAHFDGESVFGKYEPVVHRWEQVTGMAAPNPTEPNKNGRPRLNAEFASFMMGLPPGWVTAVPDITRAQQLKALGNGVVPQQAAAALTHLLRPPTT